MVLRFWKYALRVYRNADCKSDRSYITLALCQIHFSNLKLPKKFQDVFRNMLYFWHLCNLRNHSWPWNWSKLSVNCFFIDIFWSPQGNPTCIGVGTTPIAQTIQSCFEWVTINIGNLWHHSLKMFKWKFWCISKHVILWLSSQF